jgi:two-component system chemotaxis response regulator CheY
MAAEEKPTVILCATENDPQQFTLAKAAGAAHHILKPFDKTAIASKLTEIGVLEGAAGLKIAAAD